MIYYIDFDSYEKTSTFRGLGNACSLVVGCCNYEEFHHN